MVFSVKSLMSSHTFYTNEQSCIMPPRMLNLKNGHTLNYQVLFRYFCEMGSAEWIPPPPHHMKLDNRPKCKLRFLCAIV